MWCDLGRPHCDRCKKAGKECEGYRRGAVFINRTVEGLMKRQPLEEAQPARFSGSESVMRGAEQHVVMDATHSSELRSLGQGIPQQIAAGAVTFKNQQGLFLEDYLPTDSRCRGTALGLWFLESIRVADHSRALTHANEALIWSRVGRLYNDKTMTIHGKVSYGNALRELQNALLDERRVAKDETLAACQALALYEVLESTGSAVKGQKNHLYGIIRLLKYRKLHGSQSTLCEALMDYFRYSSMVLCIQQRSLALVGGLEAKDSIWPPATSLEQKLYDRGFDLADVLEKVDKGPGSRDGSFLHSIGKLDNDLRSWEEELSASAENNEAWKVFLQQLSIQSQENINFPDLRLAHLLHCFWSLRMCLYFILGLALKGIHQTHGNNSPSGRQGQEIGNGPETNHQQRQSLDTAGTVPNLHSSREYFAKALQSVDLILRATPYCIGDEMGLASCLRCMFGLRGCLGFLRFNPELSERLQKCQTMVAQLAEKRGISFMSDIARLSGRWGDTPEAYAT